MNKQPINKVSRSEIEHFDILGSDGLDTYQNLATRSAIYPGRGTPLGLAYVALKMNGEAGEFAEHVGKAMRDDDLMPQAQLNDAEVDPMFICTTGELTSQRRALLIKEIGDVLWYLSAACNELGTTLGEVAVANLNKIAGRTERGTLQGSGDER